MKKPNTWSYAPYKPLFFESGDIYICRIVPSENSIHIEWLEADTDKYEIYCRARGENDFLLAGETDRTEFDINGLSDKTDYEFYVCGKSKSLKSRVRLAKTGNFPYGSIVNYLHPDDEAYSFSGRYLCSPSILRCSDGHLLASMDLFAGGYPQNLTLVFRSDDNGKTWKYQCELFPCFWGKLFEHNGEVYMFGCSTEYGDMLIGKSIDGGKSFCEPTILYRGGNGKNGEPGLHRNPQVVLTYGGRIWNTVEWGSWARGYHSVIAVSAPIDSDLLDSNSWEFTYPVKYDKNWNGVPEGESTGNIEGCPVIGKDGKLYSLMRFDMSRMTPNHGYAILYEIDAEHPAEPMKFAKAVPFPGNHSKFEVKLDKKSGYYYSIVSRNDSDERAHARNVLSLARSADLLSWEIAADIIDESASDPAKIGFQYVDFMIEGDEIIYLCRTGWNGAANMHDTNMITLGRINLEKYR